jgi:endonuclease YncB( thermonuclease family)
MRAAGVWPVLSLIPVFVIAFPPTATLACIAPSKPPGLTTVTVEHVSDGDTVRLRFPSGRRERTRLIGVDAPEASENEKLERDVTRTGRDRQTILALGRQASAFTRQLLPQGTLSRSSTTFRSATGVGDCWPTCGLPKARW